MLIRFAEESDLSSINDIYNHYVINAFATFDVTPCTLEARKEWFLKYNPETPYQLMVAVENEKVIGWACTSKYRDHFAFAKTAEVTAYIHPEYQSKGVGSALYTKLFESIEVHSLRVLLAGIAMPNEGSVQLHKKFGFTPVGVFEEYAQKNGNYISSLWMQKKLS